VLALIEASAGRDCDRRIATRKALDAQPASDYPRFAIRPTRDSHTDAAPAIARSLFRFASVASGPRFSQDPVNLAPDWDG
jgi:hypothetical protein